MSLDYLKFVEAHENYDNFNVFEKVLMATQRAKAIYDEEKEVEEEDDVKRKKRKATHKPTYQAILEINEGKVQLTYASAEVVSSPIETTEPDDTVPDDQESFSE
ncbi:MAG: DNA-directed RNA polymerase subunit omega [SAR324 cluster bacterium]|nr:DNA-directed RNA polymerase subunit omega [SAR324 cluster bacterium]